MDAHDPLHVALVARAAAVADGGVAVQPHHRRPGEGKVAPALAIVALDVLFKVGNNVWRAASDLLMYAMIAFGLYLIVVLIRLPIERAAKARKERAAAAKAAAAAEPDDEPPFGVAGDDRYGRPPVPSNPQRSRIEPRL
jgi:hypothetical protein